jgi:plasmid maintenance system antidote protein VapI
LSRSKTVAERLQHALLRNGATVTDVAKALVIGRPALSNVLNGNAALSIPLALKIEAVFGLKARALLVAQLDQNIGAARLL